MRRLLPLVAMTMASVMAADLPVREVVLYKSGVGYFERGGRLGSGESARLDFKAAEMNDVLKSLTIADNAGKVVALRYDSSEPLEQKLSDFPFQVGGGASLSAFLGQLQGARISIKYGTETIDGTIVSARTVAAEEKKPEREQVVLLLDSGEMRTLDLAAAGSLHFPDPKLQLALKDYLSTVAQSRSKDKRSVYIDSSDAKERQVSAVYMLPMPVWKSSYRLMFAEQGEPTLEGWAIVDNTTSDDWTNVRLAVVSGRPVSFISQLYEPKYVQRRQMDLADNGPAGPIVYEGAMSAPGGVAMAPPPPPPAPMQAAPRALAKAKSGAVAGFLEDREISGRDAASSITINTEGRDLGDLFEYRFGSAVTVKRGESAMLPFLQQKLGARKLLIYSESYGQNPMSAAELTNSTGKTLDGGPITVFDSNSYAGEALMESLKAGDKRLISYAVDLGTRITTAFDTHRETVREMHFRRGILTTRVAAQETKTYSIRNVDQKAKTLIIEHPQRAGYKLLDMKPAETTTNAYRFEVKLGPGATEKFPVNEERVYDMTTQVSNMTPDLIASYVANKALPDAAKKALQQVADVKRQIADNDEVLNQTTSDITELSNDQQRIRQNIESLNNVSGQQDQVQKYARQLAQQETQLATFRDRQSQLRKQKSALESNLNSLIEKIDF
ncbi:MAG TPA: hypothetical protein VKU01_33730 [Bryobacteraceae bacterium]|nr:hypothetical protein [Bryobacteraceae bacterium]